MTSADTAIDNDAYLGQLLDVVERIALNGDLQAVAPLLDMTAASPGSPRLTLLAEAFARMLVRLEAKEYELECTIDDLLRVKKELEQANYDPLTRLANRVIARDRLQQGLQQARRSLRQVAVLYLDLDRFKWVNDNLGHAAGDELLRQVAQRMTQCARQTDTVARLGGDEFLCVLPELDDPTVADDLAARFVEVLNQPFTLAAGPAKIGASVGIARYPLHGDSVDQLIACADKALYQAKNQGRNCYCVYGSPSNPDVR